MNPSSCSVMCNVVDVINVLFGDEAGFVCIHASTTVFDSCPVICDCNGIPVLLCINLIIHTCLLRGSVLY